MPATLLDGRAAREALIPGLIARFKGLSYTPVLTIIQVGDRPDSVSYIRAKKTFAVRIGIPVKHVQVSENVSQAELISIIHEHNADRSVHGIIVQLPLPIAIDREAVIEAIDPGKDVDALTAVNVKHWLSGRGDAVMPATARGVRELLTHYGIGLDGRHVAVIGRSMLVGRPITAMCLNENATVTVCHSKTPDLKKETKLADVIITAVGHPGLITAAHVRKGQIVIDVGINTPSGQKLDEEVEETRGETRTLVGDVDFARVSRKVAAITPVPGGVGPMTVYGLFANLADLCTGE